MTIQRGSECCINGQEIAPAYTEQNDPIEQREHLEHQAGGEQQKLDEDFLVALEHGMSPAGAMSLAIDRLCMMLLVKGVLILIHEAARGTRPLWPAS